MRPFLRPSRGLTLVELSIALFCAGLLAAGALRFTSAATSGFHLQRDLSAMQESARFGLSLIAHETRQAGFMATPWISGASRTAVEGSLDGGGDASDTLELRRWSDRNCFDNANPTLDSHGQPRHFLRLTRFSVRDRRDLVLRCRYGPDADHLVTQVNNLGLTEDVRALQALFAEDSDHDGLPDRWVRAGQWAGESRVLAVRVAVLTTRPLVAPAPLTAQSLAVADAAYAVAPGRLARVSEMTIPILGRQPR